jgi:uncharacterized membrane protein
LHKDSFYLLVRGIVLKNSCLYSALVAAINITVAQAERAPPENNREKCYGVAKAGDNECAGTSSDGEKHSCPGWSEKDNDPYAWSYVLKGECLKKGGAFSPPPLLPKKLEQEP